MDDFSNSNNDGIQINEYDTKPRKPSRISELWQKLKDYKNTPKGKKVLMISLVCLIILLLLSVTVYNRYFATGADGTGSVLDSLFTGKSTDANKEKTEVSKLDGAKHPASTANRNPLAVMVENHPDARPHSGLDKASVVYEAIAEGGITRFMAVFGPNAPEKVGPVRSARTYYLDWALEYDAFYSHVGGNIDALDLIPQIGIKDLDQFKYGTKAYWREPQAGIATEHTMYTDLTKLYDIAKDNDWDMKADFQPLLFKDDLAQDQRPEAHTVTVNFSTNTYKVDWKYDPETNTYLREMADSPHKDAITGEQLTAKNVVVQEVAREATITRINENGWKMTTVGSGKAKIYLDGKEVEATWKKKSRDERTRFYNLDGQEIEFNPGVTWYEIVHSDTSVVKE